MITKTKLMLIQKLTIAANWVCKSYYTRFAFAFAFLFLYLSCVLVRPITLATIILTIITCIVLFPVFFYVRLGNVLIVNRFTGFVYMSLAAPQKYWQYSYIFEFEKEKMARLFKKEFTEDLLKVAFKHKRVKMKTHKWVVENIIKDEKIISRFIVDIRPRRAVKLKSEILNLVNPEELKQRYLHINKIIKRKRVGYTVILQRRGD